MEVVIRDIPRLYTGIAEWSACLVTILLLRRRIKGWRLCLVAFVALVVQSSFLVVTASFSSDILWLCCMFVAVALMYLFIWICCDVPVMDSLYFCARDLILAEFMASFVWQIHCFIWPEEQAASLLAGTTLLVAAYFIICYTMMRLDQKHIPADGVICINQRELISVIVTTLGVFMISNLSFVPMQTPFSGLYENEIMNIRTIVDLGGIAILYAYFVQRSEMQMRRELEATQNIIQNQYQQYQMSRDSIELINRKYHDFKHQIEALRAEMDVETRNAFLDELENEIKNYEAQNKTGNQVLDTLLTSKSMYCAGKHITLTSVVDGKLLNFMSTMDLCSIFGNALDNAIECEQRISDERKRLIHLSVSAQKGFILIHVENYFEGDLEFQNDLPVTSKEDKSMHGYGVKSMRLTAQKYHGTLTTKVENGWFELKILIPIPKEALV